MQEWTEITGDVNPLAYGGTFVAESEIGHPTYDAVVFIGAGDAGLASDDEVIVMRYQVDVDDIGDAERDDIAGTMGRDASDYDDDPMQLVADAIDYGGSSMFEATNIDCGYVATMEGAVTSVDEARDVFGGEPYMFAI